MKKKKGTNVYEKKVTLGRDPNGTPIRKSITGRTIAELNQRIEEAKQKWMEMNTVTDGVLFSTYARRWLANAKAVRSINTKRMYRETLDRHIIPEIGDLYFSEISLADLQKIINDRADKYETCNKIRLTLRQIYDAAMEEESQPGTCCDKKIEMLRAFVPEAFLITMPPLQGEVACPDLPRGARRRGRPVAAMLAAGPSNPSVIAINGADSSPYRGAEEDLSLMPSPHRRRACLRRRPRRAQTPGSPRTWGTGWSPSPGSARQS